MNGNLVVRSHQVDLGEDGRTEKLVRVVMDMTDGVAVGDGPSVLSSVVATGTPTVVHSLRVCGWFPHVFTAPLHNNGSYFIVAWVCVAARMCLPRRYLAMNVYSDFTILAFGRHVTILVLCVTSIPLLCHK
jgi:hypothetical protein